MWWPAAIPGPTWSIGEYGLWWNGMRGKCVPIPGPGFGLGCLDMQAHGNSHIWEEGWITGDIDLIAVFLTGSSLHDDGVEQRNTEGYME